MDLCHSVSPHDTLRRTGLCSWRHLYSLWHSLQDVGSFDLLACTLNLPEKGLMPLYQVMKIGETKLSQGLQLTAAGDFPEEMYIVRSGVVSLQVNVCGIRLRVCACLQASIWF